MSDREFENYLALLSRLLRLSGKRRAQIADEFRAHLDNRLDELTSRGVTHDEAVRQALEEFGDAKGLAGQFAAISQNRKQRWLVRMTTFSVVATLLIAAGLIIFWPGRNAAPGRAVTIAQQTERKDQAPPETKASPARPPFDRIEAELGKLTNVDFVEQPLKDVVMFISEMHSIPIVLKLKRLEEAGVSADTPVTKTLRGIRLGSALNIILEDLELTYLVKDEVLQITTPNDAQATTEIRIYDCRDILAMPVARPIGAAVPNSDASAGPGALGMSGMGNRTREHEHRAEQLMTIITTNVDPQTWQGAAGSDPNSPFSGAVSEYNGLVVVTQTAQTHKKIERVLDMLREAAGLDVSKTGKVVR